MTRDHNFVIEMISSRPNQAIPYVISTNFFAQLELNLLERIGIFQRG
jgi:hypothetical protein